MVGFIAKMRMNEAGFTEEKRFAELKAEGSRRDAV